MDQRSSVEESELFQRIHNDVVDSFDEELELELEDHEHGDGESPLAMRGH